MLSSDSENTSDESRALLEPPPPPPVAVVGVFDFFVCTAVATSPEVLNRLVAFALRGIPYSGGLVLAPLVFSRLWADFLHKCVNISAVSVNLLGVL